MGLSTQQLALASRIDAKVQRLIAGGHDDVALFVIPLGPWGILRIPGFLVWAALLYAGIGTWITVRIGRPLVALNFDRQRYEADFRFSLVRLRENAERVAIYGGEQVELGVCYCRYQSIFENFWRIMKRQRVLGWFTSGCGQPLVIASLFYGCRIKKKIEGVWEAEDGELGQPGPPTHPLGEFDGLGGGHYHLHLNRRTGRQGVFRTGGADRSGLGWASTASTIEVKTVQSW
jgi:hypothetical protein